MPKRIAAAALIMLLVPTQAAALPGPEVVLPLAAGIVQAFIGAAWIAGRLRRRVRRRLWRIAVLAILGIACAVLISVEIAVLAVSLAGALGAHHWPERLAWSAVAAAALYVAPNAIGPAPLVHHPPVLPPFDGTHPPAGPFPRAGLEVLRRGPAHVIHLGEEEDFLNCAAPGGVLLRPADLEPATEKIRSSPTPAALLMGPTCPPPDVEVRARALGHEHVMSFVPAFQDPKSGLVCYQPPLVTVIERVVPRALYSPLAPGAPMKLDWAPWLRPHDLAHLGVVRPDLRVVLAKEVLATPTDELAKWRGPPLAVLSRDSYKLAAAGRLLTGQGVEVAALSRGMDLPRDTGYPLSRASMIGVAVVAAVLVMLAGLLGRIASQRAEAAHGMRRRKRWHIDACRVAGEALAWLVCGAVAWRAGSHPVPPSLAAWITPTMVGPEALQLGVACFLAAAVALWVRVALLPAWWRMGAAALAAGLLIAAVPAVTHGVGPLPLHFALIAVGLVGGFVGEVAVVTLWRRRSRARGGHAPGLALLEHVAGLQAAGGKAARLGRLRAAHQPVPPGVVVWTDRTGRSHRTTVRLVKLLLGRGPYLVRSTARAEDREEESAAGRYPSLICRRPDELAATVRAVVAAYPDDDGPLPAALIMPLIACTRAGVAQVPLLGTETVLVEYGAGRDEVTSGAASDRVYWGRRSGRWLQDAEVGPELEALGVLLADQSAHRPRYLEWLARGGRLWWVQDRPAPAAADAGATSPVAALAETCEPPDDPSCPWLRQASGEGLPEPAPARSLELWAQCWQRGHALGDALALLGLPRWLAPRQAVAVAWGGLWAFEPQVELLARLVQLRLSWAAALRRRPVALIAGRLAARCAAAPVDFRAAVAASVALRLLQGYLDETSQSAPPTAPTVRLAAALRTAGSPGGIPACFGYRATHDLDPTCPRYGELTDEAWSPPDEPLPWPAAEPPATLDRSWCALLRDCLHDRLAWETARLRAGDSSWRDEPPAAATAPPWEVLSLLDAEAVGLAIPSAGAPERGTWVSGKGPVEGIAARDGAHRADGQILLVDAPTAELAAQFHGFAGVVAARGGMLSHAALVAREEGIPALFGVGHAALNGQGRIALQEDGSVEWLAEPRELPDGPS